MRIVCAHYISNYLFTTVNWLYTILRPTETYEPVVLARKTSNLAAFPLRQLYAVSELNGLAQAYNLAFYKTLGYFPLFATAAKKNGVELLHVHFGHAAVNMLALKRKLGTPMITSFLGIDASKYLRLPEWRKKYRRLFAEGDLFLALGPRMREALAGAGCPADKIKVHNLGIIVEEFPFRERRLEENEQVMILMGASFREKKGIPYALAAAAILKARAIAFQLVIAGDGPLRSQIEQQITTLGLWENVKLLGYVAPAAFRRLMEQAHLLILPSLTASDGDMEGTPFVLMEALAMGIPVVSTYHADIPEIVKDGVNGYLVPEKDAEALAERLIHLIEHPEAWGAMGRAGREHVMEHFNAENQFAKLLQIYAGLRR
jgi:colanic acid/amylovoran biosynthesis glycosyltransferase